MNRIIDTDVVHTIVEGTIDWACPGLAGLAVPLVFSIQ